MRRYVVLAVLALAGCGGVQRFEGPPLCADDRFFYGDTQYAAVSSWDALRMERGRATTAREGGCELRAVRAWEVNGLPPTIALATDDDLYIAPGELVVLPRHPLHRAVFVSAPPRRACRRDRPVRGRVLSASALGEQIRLDVAGRLPFWVRLDPRTRVEGEPRLPLGTRVRVTRLRCQGTRQLARTITRL